MQYSHAREALCRSHTAMRPRSLPVAACGHTLSSHSSLLGERKEGRRLRGGKDADRPMQVNHRGLLQPGAVRAEEELTCWCCAHSGAAEASWGPRKPHKRWRDAAPPHGPARPLTFQSTLLSFLQSRMMYSYVVHSTW